MAGRTPVGNYPGNGARFSRLVVVRDASVPVKGLLCDNIKWDALTPGLTQGTVDGEFVRLLHDVSSARGRVLPGPQARRGRRTDHYYSIASPLQSSGEAGRTAEYVEGRGLPLAEFRVMMASASRAALTGSADVRVQADAAYARDWAAFADAVVAVRTAELAGAGGPPAGVGAPGGGGTPRGGGGRWWRRERRSGCSWRRCWCGSCGSSRGGTPRGGGGRWWRREWRSGGSGRRCWCGSCGSSGWRSGNGSGRCGCCGCRAWWKRRR